MKSFLNIIVFATFTLTLTHAQNYHDFYDDSTLEYWQNKYGPNIKAIFQEELVRYLPQGCVINVNVPKLPNEQIQAFNFYATGNNVVIPASAVLFLDQLLTAYVWLELNGYSVETLSDYLGMLKHQSFSHYPLPWPTLGIPDNPYSNSIVNTLTQEYLKTAILWILAHECGHVCLMHSESNVANEIEADEFANKMFRKMGYIPKGIIYYFIAITNFLPHEGDFIDIDHWEEYNSKHQTHPYSEDRLSLLAKDLRNSPDAFVRNLRNPAPNETQKLIEISKMLDQLVVMLRDPDIKDVMTVRSLAAKPETLKPRTIYEPPWIPKSKEISNVTYNGNYKGIFNHYLESGIIEPLNMEMSLNRSRNMVEGTFNFSLGAGKIKGIIDPENKLLFEWEWGNSSGQGVLKESTSPNFDIEAIWGYNTSNNNGGTWKLFNK